MPQSLASLLGDILVFTVCAFALLVGGARERWAAGAFAAGLIASLAVQRASERWDPAGALLLIDLALLAILGALAWRPKRAWPVAAVAAQGLTVALDLLRLTDMNIPAYTYLSLVAVAGYGLAAAIGWGAVEALRERLRR
jgi:hypothetical protein